MNHGNVATKRQQELAVCMGSVDNQVKGNFIVCEVLKVITVASIEYE